MFLCDVEGLIKTSSIKERGFVKGCIRINSGWNKIFDGKKYEYCNIIGFIRTFNNQPSVPISIDCGIYETGTVLFKCKKLDNENTNTDYGPKVKYLKGEGTLKVWVYGEGFFLASSNNIEPVTEEPDSNSISVNLNVQ